MIKTKKTDQFGLIRFLMSICLIICHFNILAQGFSIDYLNVLGLGKYLLKFFVWLGTCIGGRLPICFFVISGAVTFRCYKGKIEKGELGFKTFVVGRVARLFPLLGISILYMTVGQLLYYYNHSEWWMGRVNGIWEVIISLTGLSVGSVVNQLDTVNGPIWYISVLLYCYFIFWMISLKQKKWLYLVPLLLGMVIISYNINLPFLTESCACGYIGFFVGCLMCILQENKKTRSCMIKIAIGMLGLFIVLFCIFRQRVWNVCGEYYFAVLWPFLSIFILVDNITFLRNIMSNKVFDYLGKISWPIYLLHIPTICIMTQIAPWLHIKEGILWILIGVVIIEAIVIYPIDKKIQQRCMHFLNHLKENGKDECN